MKLLSGLKSFAIAAAIIGVGAAYGLGYIDQHTRDALLTILGGGAVAALRDAINTSKRNDHA